MTNVWILSAFQKYINFKGSPKILEIWLTESNNYNSQITFEFYINFNLGLERSRLSNFSWESNRRIYLVNYFPIIRKKSILENHLNFFL